MPPRPPAPPDGHLPLPLLRQYVAGVLPAAEQHRIEAHALSCPRCTDVLEGLAVSDATTTDAGVAALRLRLRQRLAAESVPQAKRVAWRALAAVLLLLVLSTAAWFGLRPEKQPPGNPRMATAMPEAAPKISSPVAANLPPVPAPATISAKLPPLAAPRHIRKSRQVALAKRRPAPSVLPAATATMTDALAASEVPPATRVSAESAQVARAALAPATSPPPATATQADTVGARESARRWPAQSPAGREEGAARKAVLPPPTTISPQPVGGYTALREYLHRENTFKPDAPDGPLDGTVRLKLTVTAAGKLENIRVVKGIRPDYNAEAIRLICDGPAWQPGAANGRRADQVVEISVSF